MTATKTTTDNTTTVASNVGNRVLVQRLGQPKRRRVNSIHHRKYDVGYVARTNHHDGGMGEVLNIWMCLCSSSLPTSSGDAR